jgi:hypothetical protein
MRTEERDKTIDGFGEMRFTVEHGLQWS